jgi:signal transduction histidine kinase
VELHTPVADDFCIKTNLECLKRMLGCLLENAVKFTEKGKISLTVKQAERVVHFIVEDTGCGISPEALPHIFDRFSKADEFKKGLGLGLAYCFETAQKLDGSLEYDTTYTNGCRFVLILPLTTTA